MKKKMFYKLFVLLIFVSLLQSYAKAQVKCNYVNPSTASALWYDGTLFITASGMAVCPEKTSILAVPAAIEPPLYSVQVCSGMCYVIYPYHATGRFFSAQCPKEVMVGNKKCTVINLSGPGLKVPASLSKPLDSCEAVGLVINSYDIQEAYSLAVEVLEMKCQGQVLNAVLEETGSFQFFLGGEFGGEPALITYVKVKNIQNK